MSEYLPYGGLEWLKNFDNFDVMSISEKSETGYILEVQLEYIHELHDLHNDYLLAPEKFTVSSYMLSKHCKEIADKFGIKVEKINPKFRQQN